MADYALSLSITHSIWVFRRNDDPVGIDHGRCWFSNANNLVGLLDFLGAVDVLAVFGMLDVLRGFHMSLFNRWLKTLDVEINLRHMSFNLVLNE